MNKLIDFIFHNKYRRVTILSRVYSAYFRFRILHTPMEKLKKKMGVLDEETPNESLGDEYKDMLRTISMKVNGICERTKWESKCLVRALTAQKLLKHYKVPTTLYLGVRKGEEGMLAHAWLRAGNFIVTGANRGEFKAYAVVAKFRTQI